MHVCVNKEHAAKARWRQMAVKGFYWLINIFINQCMLPIVQSHCQSHAWLMFAITLEMNNFDCQKINEHFRKFTACLLEELIHKVYIASPTFPPYVNNSQFCSCTMMAFPLDVDCMHDSAFQHNQSSTGPRSPTSISIWPRDPGLLNYGDYSLLIAGWHYITQLNSFLHNKK